MIHLSLSIVCDNCDKTYAQNLVITADDPPDLDYLVRPDNWIWVVRDDKDKYIRDEHNFCSNSCYDKWENRYPV